MLFIDNINYAWCSLVEGIPVMSFSTKFNFSLAIYLITSFQDLANIAKSSSWTRIIKTMTTYA